MSFRSLGQLTCRKKLFILTSTIDQSFDSCFTPLTATYKLSVDVMSLAVVINAKFLALDLDSETCPY